MDNIYIYIFSFVSRGLKTEVDTPVAIGNNRRPLLMAMSKATSGPE